MHVKIRPATQADIEVINRIIEAAVMTWDLPVRVKRLSLPVYRYDASDLAHLDIVVAEDNANNILGVASWEQAEAKDTPAGQTALLLHGIYVDPAYHHHGIGQQLFRHAEDAAQQQYDGLLVKAQTDANGFFLAQGMSRLPVKDVQRNYANRFWKNAANRY